VVEDASWGVSEELLFLAKMLSSEPIAHIPHPVRVSPIYRCPRECWSNATSGLGLRAKSLYFL
jgi:hypothetical protein